jgi:DNA-binding transcriptional LysR family regulator
MNRFTLRQIEYFVAAGRHGNLTAAAHELHVSQPAITQAIAQLEDLLGEPLFERQHGSGVTFTTAGLRAFTEGQKLLSVAEDFTSAMKGCDSDIEGTVQLGFFEPMACYYLPALIDAISTDLPSARIDFSLGSQKQLHAGIQSRRIDLAVSYDSGFWEDLDRATLFHVVPLAVLPAHHQLAAADRVSLRDLCQEPFILVDLPESREYQLSVMRAEGVEPKVRYYCSNIEVLRGLVAHGLGVSLAVTRPVGDRSYDGSALAYRQLAEPVPPQAVVVAQNRDARLTRVAGAVRGRIIKYFREDHRGPPVQ